MPLFMDFHIIPDVTIEDVKLAHIADKAVQRKYGVKYHQFWVNEEAGTVFCLMEGPDKESCEATHREAHGNIACKIEEVEIGFYSAFMDKNTIMDGGTVLNRDGTADKGYRFVLALNIYGNTNITSSLGYQQLQLPDKPKNFALDKILEFHGKKVRNHGEDSILSAFKTPESAIACAVEIKTGIQKKFDDLEAPTWDVTFKMGIAGGQPLTKKDGFFEQAINLSTRLGLIAGNREILVSGLTERLCDDVTLKMARPSLRILGRSEERFLNNLFDITEEKLSNDRFSVQSLGNDIGLSRPQLYRKVKTLTGHTPNTFIRDLKMHKALNLLKEKQLTVSQIALEVGYSNPSYFSKCFQDKFGIAPSHVVA